MVSVALLVALAPSVIASWDGNLNYRSPSLYHENLGINMHKVQSRSLEKRDYTDWKTEDLNFTHGVASGDPYADSVILWTRVAPTMEHDSSNVTVEGDVELYSHETERWIAASTRPICVDWTLHEDAERSGEAVASGRGYTTSDIDYTLKVEATGLKPFTVYYYQFNVCDTDIASPLGRTKTIPAEEDEVPLTLGVFSCAKYYRGYFNAYGNAARKGTIDYIVHLGDYFYEDEDGHGARAMDPPRELATLYDFRTRLGQYRTDEDLQLSHQQYPWITTWDDHEISNNNWRAGSSQMNNTEESFIEFGGISFDTLKMNAVRAYFEWMPIRQADLDDNLRIWRSFKMGKLFDLIIAYDRSVTSLRWNNDHVGEDLSNDASRTLMGGRQEKWFYRQLSESSDRGAAWRVVGNQIIFSNLNQSGIDEGSELFPASPDEWSGYNANRNRTLKHIVQNGINNTIMLAGDSHANWVSDINWEGEVEYDAETGEGSLGVEFAVTAVSSDGYGEFNNSHSNQQSRDLVRDNPALHWAEGYYRGYLQLSIEADRVDARFWGSPSVATRNPYELPMANFTVRSGDNFLQRPFGDVVNGAITGGFPTFDNTTLSTDNGTWFEQEWADVVEMFLWYPEDFE